MLYCTMAKRKVIVIGAGIGGLSAAGMLAFKGFDVTILEKNSHPGGKILRFKKDGFTFDGGPSFITLISIYRKWFKDQNKNLEDYIQLSKMDKTTTFHFQNGKHFTLYSNPQKVREEIARVFPGNENGFDEFMKLSGDIFELLYAQNGPQFAARNYHKLFGLDYIFHPKIFSWVSKLHVFESWKSIVDRLFKSSELKAIFSYQATFLGMKPSEALGTYCFFPYAEINDGMYTVKGGIYGIVEGFIKRLKELNVQIIYGAEVEKLNYENNVLTSVTTKKGTYSADLFVNNTDGAWFYTNLIPQEKNKTYTEKKLRNMKHTNSYFTINLGLKNPVKGLNHHTFFVGNNWNEFTENILKPNSVQNFDKNNICYYFLQPSLLDSTTAPQGKATTFILIPVCGYDPDFDWNAYENTFKNTMYDVIEQRDGIPIRSLIETEIIYSPARWGKEINLWENIILSFSLNLFQANGFRMPNKSKEFSNLYFAGSSTIPGPGIPPCITSGQLVTERILEDSSPSL